MIAERPSVVLPTDPGLYFDRAIDAIQLSDGSIWIADSVLRASTVLIWTEIDHVTCYVVRRPHST
jgi:hypothetical protein